MKTQPCPICKSTMSKAFSSIVLQKYSIDYFFCSDCGFLNTEKAFWLDEAYSSAIANADTGLVARNISLSRKSAYLLYSINKGKGDYLDIAGGTGLYVRLMRDLGFNFYWEDPYCNNIHANGFEHSYSETKNYVSATAFEVLEHTEDPKSFIINCFEKSNTRNLVFTTELFDGLPPDPNSWWYYMQNTGQHISFFQRKTLLRIARSLNLDFYSAGGIHVFTHDKIDLKHFKWSTGCLNSIYYRVVKNRLNSLTLEDHNQLINNEN